jgi:hypothetical protein
MAQWEKNKRSPHPVREADLLRANCRFGKIKVI